MASAGSSLAVDNVQKTISPGGTQTFKLTLTTTNSGTGTLTWWSDAGISAAIDGDADGSHSFTISSPNTFTLEVNADPTIVDGTEYITTVMYSGGDCLDANGNSKPSCRVALGALVTPGVITPEVSTVGLMSVGIIGLIGLVKLRRKN